MPRRRTHGHAEAEHPTGVLLSASAEGWLTFFDRHRPALASYANALAPTPTDAADLIQNVLLAMLRAERFPENPLAYVLGAMRHRAIDDARRAGRAAAAMHRFNPSRALGAARPEDAEATARLCRALDGIPPDHAEVVILRLRSGLTFDEIAVVVERPTGTVSSQYSRGIKALRETLQEVESHG
ncbi:MAG: sigma-70 family RNA polymerase sigma factor [Phycisphaeraceae bacterium]|nr:sigma-70 family RNA polymerase sigma factor [Phycisphaeraceae bacterium]MCW5755371.1 sigma-70 family RNA polymerase sigma factor [Phycisphaeraceae bacterium]